MPQYRYVINRTLDGLPLAEVSLSGVSYTTGLNGAGLFGGTMALDDALCRPDIIAELSREVTVFRDGLPEWNGPITSIQPSLDNGTCTISASPAWWWTTNLTNELDQSFPNGTDPADIAAFLLTTAQGKVPNGGRRIELGMWGPTGNAMPPYALNSYQRLTVAAVMNDLAQAYPGFDFDISLSVDGSNVVHRGLRLYAPFKGTTVDQTLTLAGGVTNAGFTSDGTGAFNRVHEMGSGSGFSQVIASRNNLAYTADLPMIESVISRTDIGDPVLLDLWAQGDLYLGFWPRRTFTIDFHPTEALPFGFAQNGDTVNVDIMVGNFPMQGARRVVGTTVKVDDGGDETITLALNMTRV